MTASLIFSFYQNLFKNANHNNLSYLLDENIILFDLVDNKIYQLKENVLEKLFIFVKICNDENGQIEDKYVSINGNILNFQIHWPGNIINSIFITFEATSKINKISIDCTGC